MMEVKIAKDYMQWLIMFQFNITSILEKSQKPYKLYDCFLVLVIVSGHVLSLSTTAMGLGLNYHCICSLF